MRNGAVICSEELVVEEVTSLYPGLIEARLVMKDGNGLGSIQGFEMRIKLKGHPDQLPVGTVYETQIPLRAKVPHFNEVIVPE